MRPPAMAKAVEIEMPRNGVNITPCEAAERRTGMIAEIAPHDAVRVAYARRLGGIRCKQEPGILDAAAAKNDRIRTHACAPAGRAFEIQ